MGLQLSEKDLHDENVLAEKLITLAEIIVRKHFYASVNDKEDLVSIGVMKALCMIKDEKFSPSKGNFTTYLYTGMRNDMHNYLYHQNKFNTVDIDEMMETGKDETYFQNDVINVDYSLVHTVCMKFSPFFGDSIEINVLKSITEFGFEVEGILSNNPIGNTFSYCNDILEEEYGSNIRDDMIGRLIGLILWEKKEHDDRLN